MKPLLISNARLLTESGVDSFEKRANLQSVIAKGGIISWIGKNPPEAENAEILDAQGLILTPGWLDIQLNGAFGSDFTEAPETIWDAARELPKLGTTSFLPTIITSPLETVDHAIRVLRNRQPKDFRGAYPLGLHLEGPFLNPAKKGAHNPRYLLEPSSDIVTHWARANGVYLVTLAPELDDNYGTVRKLREQGVILSIGHSMATCEQACDAFANGIRSGTHLFNAQSRIDHRNPGLSIALLNSPDIYAGVIVDGIHSHPSMVKLAWTCKGSRHFITVTDAISALGMPSGKYTLGDFEINVTQTKVTLPDGTLAGSNITQQQSLRNLLAWTGCTLQEAVRTVTETPAELLNIPNKGRIAVGADADFVLIDPDLNIKAVIVGGEILVNNQ